MDIFWQVMSLFFTMLVRIAIALLPRSKRLLISWLQSPSAVILEPKKRKSLTVSIVSPPICHEVMGPDAMILVFWMLSFKPTFSLSSFTFIKRLFSSSSSTLAWKILWMENPGRLQSMGLQRIGHDWATSLFLFMDWMGMVTAPLKGVVHMKWN